jgi:endonuclease/exonuclease/phosphatase family metal-dependent hydrolase
MRSLYASYSWETKSVGNKKKSIDAPGASQVILMGDFNAEPQSLTYREIIKEGFKSSYFEANKSEPKITFPTGLQAPYMDTDPPLTVDFIFYKVGKNFKGDSEKHIKIVKS